ncbi:M81 family metallopeptidase [Lentibacillus sp. Marseille-P4043]|uniref:M81 family metallopeptidase n=1 Tax=Lentibacillus sp. Marseille-P4043 TaxID=2040293 RepID=UPI00131A49D7|nr:M81 family metallopeptidase [Lentibacillus sp. Marseille-P4043]
MKIITGCLYHETNTFNSFPTSVEDFVLVEGNEVEKRLASTEVFKDNGVEIVPSIYATALSSGTVKKEAYRYFADKFLSVLEKNKDIDGIWLHLHGSMVVEEIGSGELALLKEIRACIGYDIPISLTLDIHGNLAEDFHQYVNIVYSYRTVPHVDQPEVERISAQLLVNAIKNNAKIRPSFKGLPMIIPGEKAVAASEPLRSILDKLKELEQRKGIISANFFICHAWNDTENTRSSIFVVPESEEYKGLADEVTEELANYVYDRRHEFEFNATVLEPQEAIEQALDEPSKPVFISDSGDNSTAGAPGMSTLLLESLKDRDLQDKKVLISAIYDPDAFHQLNSHEVGDQVAIKVGTNIDKYSTPVELEGTLKAKGDLLGYLNATNDKVGETCTLSIGNLDVIIANRGDSFITINHFTRAGVDVNDYDVIVVKQGYLFDELSAISKLDILAMTPGATYQRIEKIEYENIPRPIFPMDME